MFKLLVSFFLESINVVQTLMKVAMIFRNSLKICSGSKLFFRGLTFDFLLSSVRCSKKANYSIEQEKCEAYEKRSLDDGIYISDFTADF